MAVTHNCKHKHKIYKHSRQTFPRMSTPTPTPPHSIWNFMSQLHNFSSMTKRFMDQTTSILYGALRTSWIKKINSIYEEFRISLPPISKSSDHTASTMITIRSMIPNITRSKQVCRKENPLRMRCEEYKMKRFMIFYIKWRGMNVSNYIFHLHLIGNDEVERFNTIQKGLKSTPLLEADVVSRLRVHLNPRYVFLITVVSGKLVSASTNSFEPIIF